MTGLTEAQQKIRTSLIKAVYSSNLQTVQGIFKENGYDDIQAVLSHERTSISDKDTILDFAIISLGIEINQEKIKEGVEIIEQIWKVANQKARDSMCCRTIDNEVDNIPALKEIIQEMEEHKRVKDLDMALRRAIRSLDVNQVKAALENCGEDVERVLGRCIYLKGGDVDVLLIYPLRILFNKDLNQENMEKRKEIFGLMLGYASPWLCRLEIRKENGAPYVNYVIDKLALAQKHFATVPGVGKEYFQDLIQEFEEKLSKNELDNAKTGDQIAWDKMLAAQLLQEINHDLFENDEFNAFMDDTDLGQDNKTPEKNETTFWSEHKGKIALGVTGLCVAGAIAAYVLAYPAVALALTVLATVILMGAGIAKVLEDPSVEGLSTSKEQGA